MIPRKWWSFSRTHLEEGDTTSTANQYASYGAGREAAEKAAGYGLGNEEGGWRSRGGQIEENSPDESPSEGEKRSSSGNQQVDNYGGEARTAEQRQSEEDAGGVKSINLNDTGRVLKRNGFFGVALAQQHEDFVNGKSGEIGPELRAAYEAMSPEERKAYLLETGKPVGENYTYNPLDKGWREKVTDATTGKVGSAWRTLGGTGAGVSRDQYLDNETGEQKEARMQMVNGIIGKAIDTVLPWQFKALQGGAMAINDMKNGATFAEAGSRFMPGIINRLAVPAIDRATGGAMTAFNLGNSASAALGGPSVKSIGDAAWSAMGGTQAPGTQVVNNPDTGKPYLYPDSTPLTVETERRPSSSSGRQPESVPTTQATPVSTPEIDANLFGTLNQSGWRSATSKYAQSRKKGLT